MGRENNSQSWMDTGFPVRDQLLVAERPGGWIVWSFVVAVAATMGELV